MNCKNKWLQVLLNLDLIIAGVTICFLIVITFLGVFFRYVMNNPFTWQEELQLMCFVWVIFFGASGAVRSGSHVAIDMIVERLPKAIKKIIEILGYFVVVFVLGYLFTRSVVLIQQLSGQTTNILKIPRSLIYSCVPISCVLIILNYTADYYIRLFKNGAGEEVETDE